jgi:hypothetical protein
MPQQILQLKQMDAMMPAAASQSVSVFMVVLGQHQFVSCQSLAIQASMGLCQTLMGGLSLKAIVPAHSTPMMM